MSLIKNLVNNVEKKNPDKDNEKNSSNENSCQKERQCFIKSATDLQRIKIEKLMKNPDKPVIIPETRQEKDYLSSVPSFVRNVMGSSAGAGSGEFHVYRHLRRKEYARQKNIEKCSAKEAADEAYKQKVEQNRLIADEKTAKKRAKRLKKREKTKKSRTSNEIKHITESDNDDSRNSV